MRGLTAEEQIIELRTALLRIHSRVLLLTTALDNLEETIQDESAPSSSSTSSTAPGDSTRREGTDFQRNVLLYAQRGAARRTLTRAVRAGALIPRDALGFTVEGYPSSDEDLDILSLRPRAPESDDESETDTQEGIGAPAPEVPVIAPTRTATASSAPPNSRGPRQPVPVRAAREATTAPTVPTSAASDITAASARNPRWPASPRAARHQRREHHISASHQFARSQAEAWSSARQRTRETRRKKKPSKEKPAGKR